jgi:hypothetical protein
LNISQGLIFGFALTDTAKNTGAFHNPKAIFILITGQCEVLGKSTSLLGFQPPTSFTPLPDSQSLKGFQCKAFRHFVKMSDRELRTLQLINDYVKFHRLVFMNLGIVVVR